MKEPKDATVAQLTDLVLQIGQKLSHDIRSPFSATIGVLQLVVTNYQSLSPKEIHDLLSTLLTSNGEQLWYLDLILYWTKLELGQIPLDRPPQALALTLEKVRQWPLSVKFPSLHLPPSANVLSANGDVFAYALQSLLCSLARLQPDLEIRLSLQEVQPPCLAIYVPTDQVRLISRFPAPRQDPALPAVAGFGLFLATQIFRAIDSRCDAKTDHWLIQLP